MKTKILGLLLFSLIIVSCGPAKLEQLVEIKEHQTAFLVPLEGQTKSTQQKFMSIEYLDDAKIATKRISLPIRKKDTGRMWWAYEWIPTMKVVTVDRLPITREWTKSEKTGSDKKDQALWVESLDSIGFGIGINITAMIRENDASTYLYYYASKPLSSVIDENVRGKINSLLSVAFAEYNLEEARKRKNEIIKKVSENIIESFKEFGITITNLGLAEGMFYENPKIQENIDAVFSAEMKIQSEDKLALAQEKTNIRLLSIAENERKQAEEFAKAAEARKKQAEVEISIKLADAKLKWVEKWDGKLPEKILPEKSNLLFDLK